MTDHTQSQSRIIFCDLDLARLIEATEAESGVAFAEAHAALRPESGATSLAVAGGQAIFVGVDSPVTQAFALGLHGEVTNEDMTELEEFYRSKGAAVNIEVCPLADPSLNSKLYERGYRPLEQTNVLVRRLPIDEAQTPAINNAVNDGVTARVAQPEDEAAWIKTVAGGFSETDEALEMMLDLCKTVFRVPDAHCFIAESEGEAIAGGSVQLRNRLAGLGGASTLAAYRNRGAQTALLRCRLQHAATHGCDLATVTTLPGSGSQRNAERWRFQVAYTRTKWLLKNT